MNRYESPSIFEPPYYILEHKVKSYENKIWRLQNENSAMALEIEGYKRRQTELLQQIYNLTKHQKGK